MSISVFAFYFLSLTIDQKINCNKMFNLLKELNRKFSFCLIILLFSNFISAQYLFEKITRFRRKKKELFFLLEMAEVQLIANI